MRESQHLAELQRHHALAAAVASYEAEFGSFSDDELTAQLEADRIRMVRPPKK